MKRNRGSLGIGKVGEVGNRLVHMARIIEEKEPLKQPEMEWIVILLLENRILLGRVCRGI
jgi:hypothetical protein